MLFFFAIKGCKSANIVLLKEKRSSIMFGMLQLKLKASLVVLAVFAFKKIINQE